MEWIVSEAEDHSRLLELQAQGFSLRKIAEVVGCDATTVKRRLDKLRDAA
jgi:DNA-binding Lrp family transcriptional regulator